MAPSPPSNRDGFYIAIICALPLEADMMETVFDSFYEHPYGKAAGDPLSYTTGALGNHNVVLAHTPGKGTTTAASAAASLRSSFRRIQIAFVAGTCGVIPCNPHTKEEIVLGDCIISTAVIQYDFGRQYAQGFMRKNNIEDTLGRANQEIRSMVSMLDTRRNRKHAQERLLFHLKALQQSRPDAGYPGVDRDILFGPLHIHKHDQDKDSCSGCSRDSDTCSKDCDSVGCITRGDLVARLRLNSQSTGLPSNPNIHPVIHLGRFGSANTVMTSGSDRDRIAEDEELIAFETEGSGVWDNLPTIIIKSAYNYADSHKNKEWQKYAAATAAAGVKAVLERWQMSDDLLNHEVTSSSRPFYAIPNLSNPRFTGRESDLEELHRRFINHEGIRSLAIYGLGGIGKSQLGLAFCQKIKTLYQDVSIFWISALSLERFKQDLGRICQVCNLSSGNGDSYITAREYLSSFKAGKWLLLVDNADERAMLFDGEENIKDNLPRSDAGFTVFTTRYSSIAVDLAEGNILYLDELPLADARVYFTKSLKFAKAIQDEDAVDELLLELTCLPLAITQAAAFIMKTSVTIRKYLELMKKNNDEAIKLLSSDYQDNTREKTAKNAVAVTWLISFTSILKNEPKAADILFFISFIENNRIPLSIFPPLESEMELREAIGVLVGYSFLTQHKEEDKYDMHRLIHLAVKNWMRSQPDAAIIQERAALRLLELFSSVRSSSELVTIHPFVPHAICFLKDIRHISTHDQANLGLCVSIHLYQRFRLNEALELLHKCSAWQDKTLPEDNSDRLTTQQFLFCIALQAERSDIVTNTKVHQPVNILEGTAKWFTIQETLLCVAKAQKRGEEATVLLHKMYAVSQRTQLVAPHHHHGKFAVQLGQQYRRSGRLDKAVEILEQAIATNPRMELWELAYLHSAQAELAQIYIGQGHPEKAIQLMEDVLEGFSEVSFDSINCMRKLAKAYEDAGQKFKAEAMYERILVLTQAAILTGDTMMIVVELAILKFYVGSGQHHRAKSLRARICAYSKKDIDISRELRAGLDACLDHYDKHAQAWE